MKPIKIDFFELSFLAETCIPPTPIARSMFWDRLINEIYNNLSESERSRMFTWMQRMPRFNLENEDCQWFYARFNPENQFCVDTEYNGKKERMRCFKKDDMYHVEKNKSIVDEYITRVQKLTIPKE